MSDGAAAPAAARRASTRVRALTPAEVDEFLRRHEWGTLCTLAGGRPYAVPVAYGFDGEAFYVAAAPGRKHANLMAGSPVCLTVADVQDYDHWTSVVVEGEARRVRGAGAKGEALGIIHRQRTVSVSAADLVRGVRATAFRIHPERMAGRVRGR